MNAGQKRHFEEQMDAACVYHDIHVALYLGMKWLHLSNRDAERLYRWWKVDRDDAALWIIARLPGEPLPESI